MNDVLTHYETYITSEYSMGPSVIGISGVYQSFQIYVKVTEQASPDRINANITLPHTMHPHSASA